MHSVRLKSGTVSKIYLSSPLFLLNLVLRLLKAGCNFCSVRSSRGRGLLFYLSGADATAKYRKSWYPPFRRSGGKCCPVSGSLEPFRWLSKLPSECRFGLPFQNGLAAPARFPRFSRSDICNEQIIPTSWMRSPSTSVRRCSQPSPSSKHGRLPMENNRKFIYQSS